MFSQGVPCRFRGICPLYMLDSPVRAERAFPHNPFLSGVFGGRTGRGTSCSNQLPLVFLAWFLGGFINGVSGMGQRWSPCIVACVLEMTKAVPATCLVAVTLAVYVAWMYRAHSQVAPFPCCSDASGSSLACACFGGSATGQAGGLDHMAWQLTDGTAP